MATTTNFGWETPDDTDLVKDGALAIRTLGSAIDTSLVDLKGGTTGQVLSKASNTDMDFSWANPGKILQVVSSNNNSAKSLSNGSEYTEISTSITPKATSSKILVMITLGFVSGTSTLDLGFEIQRDSTELQQGTGGTVNITYGAQMNQGNTDAFAHTYTLLDSPSSTSALTYKLIARTNSGSLVINKRSSDAYYATSSSMILMEVGA